MSATAAPIDIVAMACRTPVGLNAPAAAAAVRAGISRVAEHPFMVDDAGAPVRMALQPGVDPKILPAARRMALLATGVLEDIKNTFPLALVRSPELLVAMPEERPGFTRQDGAELLATIRNACLSLRIRVTEAGRGHAGTLRCMSVARDHLAAGKADMSIVLGVDSYADPDVVEWLQGNEQLKNEDVPSGFFPGEAAGAIAMVSAVDRRHLRVDPLARVRGVHTATESVLIRSDGDVVGEGLFAAVAGAIHSLGLPEGAIDEVYSDINGERYRTDEWAFAVLRLGGALRRTDCHCPSECWGDVGAASGVLGCILAIRAWARAYAVGPRALIWASSEGGLRGATLLQAPGVV